MEAERDCSNIPKDDYDEVREREELAALMPLIKTARGEPIDINQLKHAIIDGLDVAIGRLGSEPSYAFKGGEGYDK